jgi:glutamate racemase
VFDSGIGGLTVVRALRRRLPGEDIVYFGDTARFPYGTKSAETLVELALEDAEFLLARGVRLVVVACHSASSVALEELRRRLSVPVVGVIEPGARAVVAATQKHRVAVIGTSATIRAGAYERAIRKVESAKAKGQTGGRRELTIVAKATPLFVPLAEEGWVDGAVPELVAREYLRPLVDEGVDALLLGCTHFPLLAGVMGRVLGSGVKLVDSSEETAGEVERRLGKARRTKCEGQTGGRLRVYVSDIAPSFESLAARFLGESPTEVMRASVGE